MYLLNPSKTEKIEDNINCLIWKTTSIFLLMEDNLKQKNAMLKKSTVEIRPGKLNNTTMNKIYWDNKK
jgi:hypothetical protein